MGRKALYKYRTLIIYASAQHQTVGTVPMERQTRATVPIFQEGGGDGVLELEWAHAPQPEPGLHSQK